MFGSCAFIVRKVLKRNDCLGKQVLFAAVAGTTVPKPQIENCFRNRRLLLGKNYTNQPQLRQESRSGLKFNAHTH